VAKGSTRIGSLLGRERINVWPHPSVDHTLFKNCASLCLQNRDKIDYGNISIVFLTLCQSQLARIAFVRKFVNTSLCLLINTKINELLGDFRGSETPQRDQENGRVH
jgi:hypothetical protein